ncbi:MAG: sirohydrochlorin cobaltochelatase [Eubacteriales bacterium]|nr:sirohydrochlorin cobaltochelatase [Eubacteriales bacterium]
MSNTKKALLVVSFGTSYPDTRRKTIDAIEQDLQAAFPDRSFYHAWTSGMLIRKVAKTENLLIPTVAEAVDAMIRDGITDLLVQPTHVLDGIENDHMKDCVNAKASSFESVCFGAPLLYDLSDMDQICQILADRFSYLSQKEALVLVGHGSTHEANRVYGELDRRFKDLEHPNIHIGTVEGTPSREDILQVLRTTAPVKVVLTPLMIVAGDHANNDIGGGDEDSWVRVIEKEGMPAEAVLSGLGEYPEVRQMLVEHARKTSFSSCISA